MNKLGQRRNLGFESSTWSYHLMLSRVTGEPGLGFLKPTSGDLAD